MFFRCSSVCGSYHKQSCSTASPLEESPKKEAKIHEQSLSQLHGDGNEENVREIEEKEEEEDGERDDDNEEKRRSGKKRNILS